MAGNLTTAVATQQAMDDPDREDHYLGLISGDYLMVPRKHTDELAKELPNLDLIQGHLLRKDADQNLPIATRAQNALPGITYATMRVSVTPLDASSMGRATSTAATSGNDSSSGGGSSKKSKKGPKSGSGPGSGSGSSGSSGTKGGDKGSGANPEKTPPTSNQ
jgi:hypothetical protein